MDDHSVEGAYRDLCAHWSALEREQKDVLLEALSVPITYNSTKLENDRIDIHDTRAILGEGSVVNYTGDLRDLYEIDNHGHAWNYICELATSDFSGLDANGLLQLQFMTTEHTYDADRWERGERPGTFKIHDYGVGLDREVGFPPEKCPGAVDELLEEVNEYLGKRLDAGKTLTVATYLHARLADIHPFSDGNGRTARLAQNLYLLATGNPPIAQRAEDKMPYFGALDLFHSEGDLSGLVSFNMTETFLTWKDSELLIP